MAKKTDENLKEKVNKEIVRESSDSVPLHDVKGLPNWFLKDQGE